MHKKMCNFGILFLKFELGNTENKEKVEYAAYSTAGYVMQFYCWLVLLLFYLPFSLIVSRKKPNNSCYVGLSTCILVQPILGILFFHFWLYNTLFMQICLPLSSKVPIRFSSLTSLTFRSSKFITACYLSLLSNFHFWTPMSYVRQISLWILLFSRFWLGWFSILSFFILIIPF